MGLTKVLYATDLNNDDLSFSFIKKVLPIQQVGLKEMVFLQSASSDDWTRQLSDSGIETKTVKQKRLSAKSILDTSSVEKVSMIVVDLKRDTFSSSRSSMIKDLIKKSSLPILFINNEIDEQDAKDIFSHIVFAMDCSYVSDKSFAFFIELKQLFKEVEIVNVINKKLTIKDLQELKLRLTEIRKRCFDEEIDAEAHIYAGKTAEELLLAAKDYKATMVMLGGISKKRIFKNSPSYSVAVNAEVPVLVVP